MFKVFVIIFAQKSGEFAIEIFFPSLSGAYSILKFRLLSSKAHSLTVSVLLFLTNLLVNVFYYN